jgi:glycosyltransferase involved in cell wall biosynthesis
MSITKAMLNFNITPSIEQENATPLVSVIVLTYCQASVVRECLMSLFTQTLMPFQLVVSDDASTDETWSVIESICHDAPKSVKLVLNRNHVNLGIGGNYNKAVSLCDGDLIFSAAGDDVSLPDRLQHCVMLWIQSNRRYDLLATDLIDLSYKGEVLGVKPISELSDWNWQRWMQERPFHAGASHMVTRRLLEVGPLTAGVMLEDQCLLFRAILMGGALRVAKPLVQHRRGGVSTNPSPRDYELKRQDILKSARQSNAEYRQYLCDANALGASSELKDYIQSQIEMSGFIIACLSANGICQRYACLRNFKHVANRKKLRYFLFSTLPWVYRFGYALKRALKEA